MALIDDYRNRVVETFDRVLATQRDAITTATAWVAESWATDGLVYVTGSGHSHMIAEEVFYRAGGAAPVQAILDPALMLHQGAQRSSQLERVEGYAETVLQNYPIGGKDVFFVVSNSGRNAFPIEAALHAKARGARVVAVTSLDSANRVASRHSSGRRLHEIAELALDTQVPHGDAAIPLRARAATMGPTSTFAAAFIMNAIMAAAVEALATRGITVDVYRSANVDNSDAEAVVARWRGRIKGL